MGFDAHDLKVAFEDGIAAERQRVAELLRSMITDNEQSILPKTDTETYLDIGEV
jgi:hypothetical protein